MVVWLEATGIPLVAVLLLVAVALLIFIALSRIVAEAGVALVRAPLIAPDFVMASMGTSFLGPKGLTGLAYTYPWTADIVTFPMAACANSLKMIHEVVRGRKRAFFWGMVLALVVTLAGAFWIVLYLSYRHGGINLNSWFWLTSSSVPLSYISMMMRSPSTTELGGWLFTGFGAGLMWLLIWVHQRVMWWPIHPLGLAMTGDGLHLGGDVVQRLFGLGYKGFGAQVRRRRFVPSDPVLFCRHDLGCLCRGWHLAGHRLYYREAGQFRVDMVSALLIQYATLIAPVCSSRASSVSTRT